MISIHLYGKLRQYAPDRSASGDSVIRLEALENEDLDSLLKRAGIDAQEIYTNNSMARWLEYPQFHQNIHDWDLSTIIRDGDRIGLFGRDMAALVV